MTLLPYMLIIIAVGASAQTNYMVLPSRAVSSIAQCSRYAPKIQGTWDPAQDQIAALESHLHALAGLPPGTPRHPTRIAHPEDSFRQYVGVLIKGRRFIYINALSSSQDSNGKPALVIVCDGGSAFWGALYDPATNTFSDLQTNGDA